MEELEKLSAALEGLGEEGGAQEEASAPDTPADAEGEGSGRLEPVGVAAGRGKLDPIEDLKRRNAGLQRRLQKELEERRALEQRLRQLEETLFYQQLSHLPPEERQRRILEYRQAKELQEKRALQEEVERLQEERAKEQVIAILAKTYNVPPEELQPFDSPEEMEHFARTYARLRRGTAEAPRFEPGESAPARRKAPVDLDEAAEYFRQVARRYRLS